LSSSAAPSLHARVFRDSLNYLLSKVIPGVAGLFSVMVFVRLVGYAEYGRYAVLFAIAMAFAWGFSGWLSQGTLRFQSKYLAPSDLQNFRHATRIGTFFSATAGGAALTLALWVWGRHSLSAIAVAVGFFVAALDYTVVLAQYQASLRSSAVLWCESVRAVASFLLPAALVLALRQKDHRLLLLGVLLGYLLPVVISKLSQRQASGGSEAISSLRLPHRERDFLAEVWRYGWPVGLWLLCQQGLVVSDRYFIQRFSGDAAAGIYASMYDLIVRSFSLVFAPITQAVHPLAMRHWNVGERDQSVQAIRSGLRWQFYLFLPIAAILFAASDPISRIILGQTNPQAAAIVLPLALGGYVWQSALLAHKPLEILCQTRRMLVGMLTALLINVGGNYWLIPRFGFRAAAYLSIASSLVYLLVLRIVTPRKFFAQDSVTPENTVPVSAGAADG
jgi:O-antigen/teichoic acid export membrane protein